MNRWALGALGAVVAAMVVFLLVEIRSDPKDTEVVTSEPEPAEEPRAPEPKSEPATRPRPPAIPKPVRMRHKKTVEEVEEKNPGKMQMLLARDVPREIFKTASACYHGHEGKYEKMVVEYTLEFVDGVGTLSDVYAVESDFPSRDLEDCVITALENFEMRDDEAPDFEDETTIDITVLALKKRARGMGVPLNPEDD